MTTFFENEFFPISVWDFWDLSPNTRALVFSPVVAKVVTPTSAYER